EYAERFLESQWRHIVHECLYRDIPDDSSKLYALDTIYKGFLAVIREAPITITYNLDDTIERLLLHTRSLADRETRRGSETVVDARLPFRSSMGVVYHPNGYVPSNLLEDVVNATSVVNERGTSTRMFYSTSSYCTL